MPLVGDSGCAPCEARQAALLGWANNHSSVLLAALVALAMLAMYLNR